MTKDDLFFAATTTPSLDAEGALHVLADLLLEQGFRTGMVTAEGHDPDRARRKFLGHVFCRAWETFGPTRFRMPHRIGGLLDEYECWVVLPGVLGISIQHVQGTFSNLEATPLTLEALRESIRRMVPPLRVGFEGRVDRTEEIRLEAALRRDPLLCPYPIVDLEWPR